MEVESKTSFGGMESKSKEVKVVTGGKLRPFDLVLRVVALALTLVAAVLLGVDKQTKVVSLQLLPTLPPMDVPVTAKWRYLSAFVYFVVSNAIACSYAALSLLLSVGNSKGNKGLGLAITVMDLVMVALLFSSNGAAGAIGLMGYEGNSRVRWGKVCNVFGKFCNQVAVALGLSFFGGLAFFLLVVMAAFALNKRH
ncbi:hypothetical protein VitviT2T_006370 [Vitis vinifera]|uniref:CASP-like protein 1E2 n=3 Tax=Vitis vinifera TaxID=29760 RepID=CSPL5_VITVI|nr:CASP-like protein 1E2 [Vitis vinifera]A7NW78.1 RecName: Full=CASP-like protein 1E2; Short=VvCASPL1E2 [Vitis vinifera]RVW55696.1 CASP-like protein 1E2 [Vitis vinifera]WJZ86959.1 hypothetical protein VitviT2T_006370 [Vitis vinifera]|eukprot:XP_002276206.1 PREDICTED: CASP-like protein 1E2 [Vitis vinifera]